MLLSMRWIPSLLMRHERRLLFQEQLKKQRNGITLLQKLQKDLKEATKLRKLKIRKIQLSLMKTGKTMKLMKSRIRLQLLIKGLKMLKEY